MLVWNAAECVEALRKPLNAVETVVRMRELRHLATTQLAPLTLCTAPK